MYGGRGTQTHEFDEVQRINIMYKCNDQQYNFDSTVGTVTGFFKAFRFYDVPYNSGRGNPENLYKTLYPVVFTYFQAIIGCRT